MSNLRHTSFYSSIELSSISEFSDWLLNSSSSCSSSILMRSLGNFTPNWEMGTFSSLAKFIACLMISSCFSSALSFFSLDLRCPDMIPGISKDWPKTLAFLHKVRQVLLIVRQILLIRVLLKVWLFQKYLRTEYLL